jgi:hypothetical protein
MDVEEQMHRLFYVLVVLGLLASSLGGATSSAFADDTVPGIPSSLVTLPEAGLDTLLPPSKLVQ